ncbi:acetyl/propionyl/methylcrotonyl-CoA carboxylase subunit alpha [Nocardioides sambongensis]|uniref:acetyl/propionyl/methylcrotonyl-CoA carboxylase subunit alpha n=1 Tax=Nocardioides sambongensis TaxID=2589074 RepID=UPI001128246A|nr:biotin carboxylase N-terminal domain-containing protein [Nocardioides sambongensis]
MSITTVLVANRGEIALRVFRTCERVGLPGVAIHTREDEGAPHTRVGETESVRVSSYLDIDAIIDAALSSGADAIHPGYGFLSENAAFARAVIDAGLTWIGPSPAVIERMGRKDAARELAVAAGVPVVPSYGLDDDPETFAYPVLVKAAAGGGGKGMRVVRSAAELPEAVAAAKREASKAFGDDTMLIEKYVESGRHIEVQVMGDAHGTVLHFGERDCSPQRRHQKVLEEAPAPTLDEDTRARIHAAAVDLAASVGYTGAGTVEFLLDNATGDFYFLEMNTRLQVEHPVTEAVTGVDLVALQLNVALGDPLPLTQADVRIKGHAIEARIYAEDSFAGFLPQAGTATHVTWPAGARVDQALESGQVVTTAYDPMLGKIIARGADRAEAVERLLEALDGTAIFGLTTNTGFLRALVDSTEFRDAAIDTAWLDRNVVPEPSDEGARVLAGIVLNAVLDTAPRGPWQPDGFRMGGPRGPLVEHGRPLGADGWQTGADATATGVQRVGHVGVGDGFVLRGRHGSEVVHRGQRFVLDEPALSDEGGASGDGTVVSPMPGTVLDVRVAEGETVSAGQVLGVVEAMKMELALEAPADGTVTAVTAAVGDQVALGATLFVVESA